MNIYILVWFAVQRMSIGGMLMAEANETNNLTWVSQKVCATYHYEYLLHNENACYEGQSKSMAHIIIAVKHDERCMTKDELWECR